TVSAGRSPRVSDKAKQVIIATGLAAVVAGAVTCGFFVRPRLLYLRQLSNHEACRTEDRRIREYRERFGRFPKVLDEVSVAGPPVDGWGHDFHYESNGAAFVLVSFGRDGKPDGTDYWQLRETGDHPSGWNICGTFDADEVMSDTGWQRACGDSV